MKTQPGIGPESQAQPVQKQSGAAQSAEKDVIANSESEASADTSPPKPPADTVGELAREVETYKDAALRARAELDNYRKRVAREKEDAIRYANNSLLESLLPIVDNFELGLQAAKNARDATGIVQGLEMVRKQLEEFLRDHGVEIVDAAGDRFDPNLHEAVAHEPSEEIADGAVVRQIRKGFKLRDRLIRPATVVVSKGPPA